MVIVEVEYFSISMIIFWKKNENFSYDDRYCNNMSGFIRILSSEITKKMIYQSCRSFSKKKNVDMCCKNNNIVLSDESSKLVKAYNSPEADKILIENSKREVIKMIREFEKRKTST